MWLKNKNKNKETEAQVSSAVSQAHIYHMNQISVLSIYHSQPCEHLNEPQSFHSSTDNPPCVETLKCMHPGKRTDCTHHTRGCHSNRLMDSESLPSKKMDQDPKGFVSECIKMASQSRLWGCGLEPSCGKVTKEGTGEFWK